jgi:hypothetical protein
MAKQYRARVGATERADLAELAGWVEGLRAAAKKAREDGNLTLADALDITRFEVYERFLGEELHPHNAQVDGPEDKIRSNNKKLRHEIAEERGQLPTRSQVELDVKGNPFAGFDAVAIDDDGNLHPVHK